MSFLQQQTRAEQTIILIYTLRSRVSYYRL